MTEVYSYSQQCSMRMYRTDIQEGSMFGTPFREEQTGKDLSSSTDAASGEDIILSTLHSILQKPSASQHPCGHTNNCSLANIPLQLHCSPCTYVLPSPSSPSFPLVTSTSAVPSSSLYHSATTHHLPPTAQLGKCSSHTALYNKNGIMSSKMSRAPWPLPTADETKDSIIKVTEAEPSESYNQHCCNTTRKRKLHMVEAKRWLFERTGGGRGGRRTSSRAEAGASSWLDDEECVKRKRISQIQLDILEAAYVDDPLPSRRTKQKLAVQLGISHKKVQIWFQNRRAKQKKQKLLGGEDLCQEPICRIYSSFTLVG